MNATDKDEFILWIADRYVDKADLSKRQALPLATADYEQFISTEGVEFGDPSHDWTRDGANTIADDSMAYWSDDW